MNMVGSSFFIFPAYPNFIPVATLLPSLQTARESFKGSSLSLGPIRITVLRAERAFCTFYSDRKHFICPKELVAQVSRNYFALLLNRPVSGSSYGTSLSASVAMPS